MGAQLNCIRRAARTLILLASASVGFARTIPAYPAVIAEAARSWDLQHKREVLEEFADLLAIPNLASDKPNIQRNASAIQGLLERRGLATQLLSLGEAPPLVVGDLTT